MKPAMSILDPSFHYVPSVATSLATTWRRFGWRPMSADERDRRMLEQTHSDDRRTHGERLESGVSPMLAHSPG